MNTEKLIHNLTMASDNVFFPTWLRTACKAAVEQIAYLNRRLATAQARVKELEAKVKKK